ncbi:hypothetical protein AAG570_010791 [Ranatra chinensis]|uniref:Reverse transcriptase domain-containing protein n=1 Tax=Ranatra chinensis TaxID=642074 RepID=A0ABD0ZBW5_9HEMI
MLDRMHGAMDFRIVDLKAGYHQIQMHPGDVEKTAFQFERGKNEFFLCMPFWLKTAPTTFQLLMDEFLERLSPFSLCFIIVFSKSKAEHCTHLGQLLRRLREFGLKASEEKSSFFQPKLKYMAHTVSARGVSANREKIEAVRSLPVPKDPKEVKSFQSMVGYYKKFIPNLADSLATWTRLLRKGVKFVVTADMIEEFNRIKEALTIRL